MSSPHRVLIVDDRHELLRALRRLLPEYDVATVDDPRSVVTIIRAGARFDVILSDLEMPHLDGVALHRLLSIEAPDQAARMVFVTASSDTNDARAHSDESLRSVPRLQKPVLGEVLRSTVATVIARRRD